MVQAIISRRGGGSKINGAVEEYVVAPGEVVKKGDFVKPKISTTVHDAVTMPDPVQLLFKLSATKALAVLYASSAYAQIKIAIISINGSTITKGSDLLISSVLSDGSVPRIGFAQLSENVFALSISYGTAASGFIQAFSYSGMTISEATGKINTGTSYNLMDICRLKDNEFISIWTTSATTNNCTVIHRRLEEASMPVVRSKTFTSYPLNGFVLANYSDTQVIAILGTKGVTISATESEIIIGSAVNLVVADGSVFREIIPTYDPTLFWGKYVYSTNIEMRLIMEVKEGSLSPYFQSLSNVSLSQGALGNKIEKITALCTAQSVPSGTLHVMPYSAQLGTIDKTGISAVPSQMAVFCSVQLDENTMIVSLYTTSSAATLRLITLEQAMIKTQMNEAPYGIALTGGSDGQTIKVAVPGGVT